MLSGPALNDERAAASRRLREAVARMKRELNRLPRTVDKVRAAMPPPQDPMSLDRLLESRGRARRHAHRAADALRVADDESRTLRALADTHQLVEEVRQGLTSPPILEDIGAMLAEGSDRPPLARALQLLEARLQRIGAQADHLFTFALEAQHDIPAGGKTMAGTTASNSTPAAPPIAAQGGGDSTAGALRDMTEMLATVLAGSAASAPASTPTSPPARRYAAVADQMTASFQAYGLPYDGVQLPHLGEPDRVRSQLIDSLQRNFAARQEDGTRVYFQTTPQPVMTRDAESDARLLRGSALVNANLLRAETESVLAIIDRLPDMLRFTPLEAQALGDARARVRSMLDQIIATASDPLGLNPDRGRYQFMRVSAAIVEILQNGEVICFSDSSWSKIDINATDFDKQWQRWDASQEFKVDRLRARTTTVRAEEVYQEIAALGSLMKDIYNRVTTTLLVTSRGVAAGKLEELLSAVNAAAAMLESDLVRFGTTPLEQEVQSLSGKEGTISLSQFMGWVRSVCVPFLGADNAAAGLLPDEADILATELDDLSKLAAQVVESTSPISYGGVWRQFDELRRFLTSASSSARALGGDPDSITPA